MRTWHSGEQAGPTGNRRSLTEVPAEYLGFGMDIGHRVRLITIEGGHGYY